MNIKKNIYIYKNNTSNSKNKNYVRVHIIFVFTENFINCNKNNIFLKNN